MKNEATKRASHARTLGPHHLQNVQESDGIVINDIPVLSCSPLISRVIHTYQTGSKNGMKQGKCKADSMDLHQGLSVDTDHPKTIPNTHGQNAVALAGCTVQLIVTWAPLLHHLISQVGFHDPRKGCVQSKYQLKI